MKSQNISTHSLFRGFLLSLGFVSVLVASSVLHAQTVIYQDSFTTSGTTPLNGRTPDVTDTTGATWNTSQAYTVSAGLLNYTNTSGSQPFSSLAYPGSTVGNFVDGNTYTLSLDMTEATSGSDIWAGFGFTSGTPGAVFNNAVSFMFLKPSGSLQYFAEDTSGNVLGQGGSSTGLITGTHLEIDLSVTNTGSGNLSYFQNGTLLNGTPLAITAAQVQSIQGVGVLNNQSAGTFDNFTFTTIPEPSTWAMMVAGFGMLLMFQRRRLLHKA